MSRAAIVATIVASILAFSSPCLAASDEELAHIGDKMSGAFRCSTYAGMSHDFKEQKRLFQIGLKAARDFVEGLKSSNRLGEWNEHMGEVSTDFMVGTMWQDQTTKADDEGLRSILFQCKKGLQAFGLARQALHNLEGWFRFGNRV
jgi:hypothetical protein